MGSGVTKTCALLFVALVSASVSSFGCHDGSSGRAPEEVAPLPSDLAGTGLYVDASSKTVASENVPFTPQYPLWTDGAKKRRWIHLPKGSTIDASVADAWQFPVGTKIWKEFSFGRPIETRYMERTPSGWRYATYVWSDDGLRATLAPARGTETSADVAPGIRHRVPGEGDCRVCHGQGETPVLAFSALQLSTDVDPNALHRETPAPGSIDLKQLVDRGLVRGWQGSTSPRIAARTPTERAALGYLHGNCGNCHRKDGALASLGMVLTASSDAGAIATAVDRASHVAPSRSRIAAGKPGESVLVDRMQSRTPVSQMPPLGTQVVDDEAVRLVSAWIDELGDRAREKTTKGEPR